MITLSVLPLHQVCAFYLTLCIALQDGSVVPRKNGAQSSSAQQSSAATTSQNRKLFGIELRPSAQALLNEVENLYGKRVIEQDNINIKTKSGIGDAGSRVLIDGSPIITINYNSGKNEDSIVHELFHLKLYAQGYSTAPGIRIGNTGKTFDTSIFVHAIMGFIHDPLQHSLFFPKMRKMGFDPDKGQRDTVSKAIREGKFELLDNLSPIDTDRFLAMYYFQFSMHFTDTKLLSDMTRLFKRAGWIKPLAMGEAMLRIARRAYPYTPQTLIDTFIRCLNVLYEGESRYTFAQWVPRTETPSAIRVAVLNRMPAPQKK